MSAKKSALLAILVLLALGGAASTASATTALRTNPGGTLLTGLTTLTNTAGGLVVTSSGVGTLTCSEIFFDADVNRNISPTSITGTLTTLTFTSCMGQIVVPVRFPSCQLSPGSPLPTIHVFALFDTGGTFNWDDPVLRCNVAGSTTSFCYYTAATADGIYANGSATLTYPGVTFAHVAGSGDLGSDCDTPSLAWKLTFTHVVQGGTNRTFTIQTT